MAISGARAGLMIVASRSAGKFKELSAILPTIDLIVHNNNLFESVKRNSATLGNIFG